LGNNSVQSVTLSNVGSPNLPVSSISLVGASAQDFSIPAKQCTGSLNSDGACILKVTFNPKTAGTLSASLKVVYGDVGSPQMVPLTGVGTPVKLSPVSINFGDQKLGTMSPPVTVTMYNLSASAVAIGSVGVSKGASFGQTNNCGSTLPAHSTCAIRVTFDPNAIGPQSGQLKVRFNAPGEPQSVNLSGTGT
jgi:hypothetical protein